jgi:hypothetical protein
MKNSLESLAKSYADASTADESNFTIGLGYTVLKAFYGSLGIQNPITADLSANLLKSCIGFLLLHPTYAPFALEDLKKFLQFIYQIGGTRVDYSSVVKTHYDLTSSTLNNKKM